MSDIRREDVHWVEKLGFIGARIFDIRADNLLRQHIQIPGIHYFPLPIGAAEMSYWPCLWPHCHQTRQIRDFWKPVANTSWPNKSKHTDRRSFKVYNLWDMPYVVDISETFRSVSVQFSPDLKKVPALSNLGQIWHNSEHLGKETRSRDVILRSRDVILLRHLGWGEEGRRQVSY